MRLTEQLLERIRFMMEKVFLGLVVSTFLLVWGVVLYEVLLKPAPLPNYVSREVITEDDELMETEIELEVSSQEELTELDIAELEIGNELVLEANIKNFTQLNLQKEAPLHLGIDYGEGISIDDILENIELIIGNN